MGHPSRPTWMAQKLSATICSMNTGTVFQDKRSNLIRLIVRLGDDVYPTRTFPSSEEALKQLQTIGVPFDELMEFYFDGLKSGGKLRELPGRTEDWAAYLEKHTSA